jgi:U1 small nuclear ribonucleoprotein
MTALLPPNLLKLFAPRPPVPYLKPLVKDDAKRGPNKLRGVGELVKRIRTEADEDEIKQGLKDDADLAKGKESAGTKMEIGGEEGELKEKELKVAATSAGSGAKVKKDPIKLAGVVGQEAVKMKRELRSKRKEEYKKNLEENCRSSGLWVYKLWLI